MPLHRPLDQILRSRSDARRERLRPQVELMMQRMRAHGVECEVIGSFARPSALFLPDSDINVLVHRRALPDREVWDIAYEAIHDAKIDLRFAEDLSDVDLECVRLSMLPR